jgi:amidophosphoribosyltransferase
MKEQNHPRHYCGVFGVYGHPRAAELSYYGLCALQHRGQESAGIVSCEEGVFHKCHGMGLVRQIFNEQNISGLRGSTAIGHTRYSTTGSSNLRNAQPLTVDCARGNIAVAHNGNLTNASALREELEQKGLVFQTTVDSEIIIMMLAQPFMDREANSLVKTLRRIEGAWSVVIMTEKELIGARDSFGFRPLSIGKIGEAYVLSSETAAFDQIHAEFVRDVRPGEVVIINEKGITSIDAFPERKKSAFCVFEYVYFARPDSILNGKSVYQVRKEMGRQLAREHPIQADIVVPIPDSGVCAAIGYAEESHIPFEMAFVRNHYVGRSFLQPSQDTRDADVRIKLNLISSLVKDKRVIIVDDSIVRGTTCRNRVKTLKEAGARTVHVMISCPPHRYSCVYGIDFPDRSKLMAATQTLESIREYLNADSLHYLSTKGMVAATGLPADNFCLACYDGRYPVPYDPALDKQIIEQRKFRVQTLGQTTAAENSQPQPARRS